MNESGEFLPAVPPRQDHPVEAIAVPAVRSWKEVTAEGLILLPNFLKLLGRMLRDPRIPRRRKIVAGIVLGYVLSPIDVIPDVIPLVGQVDDILLVAVALDHLLKGADADLVAEHWEGSPEALEIVGAIVEWGAGLVPRPLRRLLTRD